jgi:cell division protein FtsB
MEAKVANRWFNISFIILLAVIGFVIWQHAKTAVAVHTQEQNLKAMADTVRIIETANGELMFEKAAFVSEVAQLKTLNAKLYTQIKQLREENRTAVVATNMSVEATGAIRDTIAIEMHSDTTFTQTFKDELLEANFDVTVKTPHIRFDNFNYHVQLPLNVNVTSDRNVVVSSANPKIRITDLNAWVDEELVSKPAPKRWGLGVIGGYGLGLGSGGGGLFVGLGISYNILNW